MRPEGLGLGLGGGRRRSVRLFAVIGVVLMLSMPLFVVYDAWEADGLQDGDTVTFVFHNNGGVGGTESIDAGTYHANTGEVDSYIDVENPVREGYIFTMWTQYPDDPFIRNHEYGVYVTSIYQEVHGTISPDSGSTIHLYAMWLKGDGTKENPYSGCYGVVEDKSSVNTFRSEDVYFEQGTHFYWCDAIYDVSPMWDIPGIESSDSKFYAIGQFTQVGDYQGLYTAFQGSPDVTLTFHIVPAKISLEFLSDPTSGTITYVS